MKNHKIKPIAHILYDAFADKIKYFWFWTSDKNKALKLIQKGINLDQVIYITDSDKEIVAVATIETKGSTHAIHLPYSTFKKEFGLVGGLIRQCVYSIYKSSQYDIKLGEMYVDLVAVKSGHRGQGYGKELLNRLEQVAQRANFTKIILNVVDTNKAAKSFYEKNGFKETHFEEMNPLFKQFTKRAGFTASYTMVKKLDSAY